MGAACLFNLVLLGLGIAVIVITDKADKLASIDFTNLEQIKTDWDTLPFVQMQVNTVGCPAGWETVFDNYWSGTVTGCYVTDWPYSPWIMTYSDFNAKYDSNDTETCSTIGSSAGLHQFNTFGSYLCGQRGGNPFINTTRPDPDSGNCPEGTVACSGNTTPSNTVCYPPDQLANCPINEIYFYNQIPTANVTYGTYGTGVLGWSKNGMSLPYTTTKLQWQPCMIPAEVSKNPYASFYELESDGLYGGCEYCRLNGQYTDGRFQTLNITISVYDIQYWSGVLTYLSQQPLSTAYYAPNIITSKQNTQ
jgi:hypothetical protein